MNTIPVVVLRTVDAAAKPWREPTSNEMITLSLYEHPLDHPDHYVIRAWYVSEWQANPAMPLLLFGSMRDAESFVNHAFPDMTWVGEDDSNQVVVGCWLPANWLPKKWS